MGDRQFISEDDLCSFLADLPGDRRFVNACEGECRTWAPLDQTEPASVVAGLREARPFYSFKSALLPASEVVARYGADVADPLEESGDTQVTLIGVRGCECRVLDYLDAIMLGDPMPEPFYEARRNNCIIVGVDCAVPAPSCFCDLLGDVAYPEANYDLNLSPVEGGFLVEAGSDRGADILETTSEGLRPATDEQLQQREEMRAEAAEQLTRQNADYHFPQDWAEALPESLEELFWRMELAECVQCGGCTAVCPACYCFLLYDGQYDEDAYERTRVWDSCQFTGYSEMAGPPGTLRPDPRREHMSKFQHRFAHKFWYNAVTPGILGCVGCGRCRDTCPGAIDLRRVLTEVSKQRVKHG